MSVFGIFLAMSQIDFVLIRMVADLIVNAYTTTKFMRNKTFCREQYRHMSGSDQCVEGSEFREMDQALPTDKTPLRKTGETEEEVGV
jgi:hypothetical protein